MTDTETTRQLVTRFWAAMQANDWAAAAALFADDYVLHWPQSGERIRGAANFVAINSAYPAARLWRFSVERLVVEGEVAVTDVVVSDGTVTARAITFTTVRDGHIVGQIGTGPTRSTRLTGAQRGSSVPSSNLRTRQPSDRERNAMPSARQRDTVTPEAFLAAYSSDVQAIANALRQLVKATIPDVQERVALGWELVGYRVPDSSRSRYFCFVAPHADEVRLGFEYGVLLGDQSQLEGDGNQVRYASVHSLNEIDPQRLSSLIAEAAMLAIERRAR